MSKAIKIIIPLLLVTAGALVWMVPIGPLPGMFIGGQSAEVPASWQDTSDVHEISLEVTGGIVPRVVTIWVVQVQGDMHIVGYQGSGWVDQLADGGPVRMRLGDQTYLMNSQKITEGWENILEAYTNKYRADYPDIVNGFPAIEDARETIAVYRLTEAQS